MRKLQSEGFINIHKKTYSEFELTNQNEAANFFQKEKPAYVILATAKFGGIYSNNSHPAEFNFYKQ